MHPRRRPLQWSCQPHHTTFIVSDLTIYLSVSIYIFLYLCLCMYVFMYVSIYLSIYIYIYIYVHTYTHQRHQRSQRQQRQRQRSRARSSIRGPFLLQAVGTTIATLLILAAPTWLAHGHFGHSKRVGPLWEGHRESRTCARDTYPKSYITEFTLIRRKTSRLPPSIPVYEAK